MFVQILVVTLGYVWVPQFGPAPVYTPTCSIHNGTTNVTTNFSRVVSVVLIYLRVHGRRRKKFDPFIYRKFSASTTVSDNYSSVDGGMSQLSCDSCR